jgi:hypothetical protein
MFQSPFLNGEWVGCLFALAQSIQVFREFNSKVSKKNNPLLTTPSRLKSLMQAFGRNQRLTEPEPG